MSFDLAAGLLIANRYRLDRQLGEGGMGVVWAATHTITHKTLALKFLKAPESHRAELTRRFLREARAACVVEHPNIVQIHDVLELDDGTPVMVMELLAGESLQAKLEREGHLELGELADVMLSVLSAVGAAHAAGVVHRDLKPDNIFLARGSGGGVTVKVLDFGIAKVSFAGETAGALTGTGALLGTPFYMSPEQVGGRKDLDYRSDVWALGVILYLCLTGVLPTQGENIGQILTRIMVGPIAPLAEVAPGLPADVLAIVEQMLCRERERRLSELRQVYDVLLRYAGAGPRSAPPEPARSALAVPSALPAVSALQPLASLFDDGSSMAASRASLASAGVPSAAPTRQSASGGPVAPVSVFTQVPLSATVPGLPKRPRALGLGLAGAGAGVLLVGLAVWGLRGSRSPTDVGVPSAPVSASAVVPAPDASAPTSAPDAGPVVEPAAAPPAAAPPAVASSATPRATPSGPIRPRPPVGLPKSPSTPTPKHDGLN